jgi:hypothetical protein
MADTTPTSPTKAARDARLDTLKVAVDEWGKKEKKRYEDEAKFLQSVIDGHTGAGKVVSANTQKSSAYAVDKISQFLEG